MNNPMLPLPGLSSASGKPVVVKFDGGLLSSDGGVLALREVEQRLRVADRLAACMIDPRAADQITHSLADVIRFRLLMISAGYEDGNDANALRRDPMFKMALDLSPIDRELCSQSTISRLEESAGRSRRAADGQGDGRSVLQVVLRHGSQTDHAGHRRHVRCGPRWSAVAAVQRPLRRIRISADRRVRRRRPLRHRRASSRQAAERQGDQALPGGACCARSALTGLTPRSCCGPTATIAVPRFSIGVAPMASITSSASRQPRHCAAMSKVSKPARRRDSRPRREMASFAVSWSSSTARKAGAGSSGSSLASKRARKDRTPASSSPI